MNRKWILSALLVVAVAVAAPSRARAWLNFCNWTPGTVWVSLTARRVCPYSGCGDTGCVQAPRVFGWYALQANTCRTLASGDMAYFSAYFYAEDAAGHVWSGWDPVDTHCAPWTAFNYCDASTFCDSVSRMLVYEWIPNISYDNFTVNLLL